jgi:hypothetical protein
LCHGTIILAFCEAAMAINGIVLSATGDSPATSISTSPIVLAGPRRTLPPGYIHLGVAKEVASILREFGIDPDPIIREAGLDPHHFDDGANVIPHATLG